MTLCMKFPNVDYTFGGEMLPHLHHSRELGDDNDRGQNRDDCKSEQEGNPPLRERFLLLRFFFGFLFFFVGFFHRFEDFNLDLYALLKLFPFGVFIGEHAAAIARSIRWT